MKEQLSPAEFARCSGLSLNYVYAMLWSGKLNASKVEGQWAIPVSELERRRSREAVSA